MTRAIGLDFGTTNSALAVADGTRVELASFAGASGPAQTFRSVLYFPRPDGAERGLAVAGHRAVERYLAGGEGRLMQSLKSYLADRAFTQTNVFGRVTSLPDLLAALLVAIRRESEAQFGPLGRRLVVGRPVRFAHADDDADDDFALHRLRLALSAAGFDEVVFEYEPVAAAYYYELSLDHDELVLVADFGGGTSDFSLVDVGPGARRRGVDRVRGSDGVALAGDALDGEIVRHVLAPELGLGTTYRSLFGRNIEVPVWIYTRLRRWHHVSFLKAPETMRMLGEIAQTASAPARIAALRHLIGDDLGYAVYEAVESTKVALSSRECATLVFDDPPLCLDRLVERGDFEAWCGDLAAQMERSVDRLLSRVGVSAADVDRVFLTGGSSFVPVVRAIFERRFGADKLRAGGELVSVASGLALRAREI